MITSGRGLVQRAAGDCESRGDGRMGVANGLHVRAHAIKQKMHGDLGRDFAAAGNVHTVQVGDYQIFRRQSAFVDAGGSVDDAAVVEAYGKITFAGHNVAAFVQPSSGNTNIAAMLLFRFCGTW